MIKNRVFRLSQNSNHFYNWIVSVVDFKFILGISSEIQVLIDPIVEYFITIVESSLVLRQPVLIGFNLKF